MKNQYAISKTKFYWKLDKYRDIFDLMKLYD